MAADEESGLQQLDTARQESFRALNKACKPPCPAHHNCSGHLHSSRSTLLKQSSGSTRKFISQRNLGSSPSTFSSKKAMKMHSTRLDIVAMTPRQRQIFFLKRDINRILNNPVFSTTMTLLTIYALYGDDIRMLFTPPSADAGFTWMSSIAFFFFIIECILSCVAKPDYFHWNGFLAGEERSWETFYKYLQTGSFYFWLDVIATASLIFEISWIYDTGSETESVNNSGSSDSGLQSARAGRASRAGARAGRVVRVVRMVRLVRLVKLYRILKEQVFGSKQEKVDLLEEEEDEMPPESRVGAMMSDLTTRRVIVGVLMMLILIPLLLFEEQDQSALFGLNMVHEFGLEALVFQTASEAAFRYALSEYSNLTSGLMSVTVFGTVYHTADFGDRRDTELQLLSITEVINGTDYISEATVDNKSVLQSTALYGILLTTFVICLLAAGSMTFTRDVNKLVINPIEVMVDLVRKINADPIGFDYKVNQSFQEGLETTMLLTTIQKIGGLMRVGFGEAGASIIAKNLSEGAGQQLNLLTAGTKIQAIFGFCDIRNFTDTTECLQAEVMLFVNRIASILHELVSQCKGAANKNIGDAFLLTWKIEENWSVRKVADHADQALYAFALTVVEMAKNEEFVCQFSHQALARLYARMPGYKVKMGFGLHYGWAIEGAIGSERKIDASYISPHVNMSEFLESSTKQYGVILLMSEAFYKLLSSQPKRYIRKVDSIKRAKNEAPMCLYTYDMDAEQFMFLPSRRQSTRRRSSMRDSAHDIMNKIAKRISRGSLTPLTSPSSRAAAQAQSQHSGILEVSSVQSTGENLHLVQTHIKSPRTIQPLKYKGTDEETTPRTGRKSARKMGQKDSSSQSLNSSPANTSSRGNLALKKEKGKKKKKIKRKDLKKVQPRDDPKQALAGLDNNVVYRPNHAELSLGRVSENMAMLSPTSGTARNPMTARAHRRRSSISLTSPSFHEELRIPAPTAPTIKLPPYSPNVWDDDPDLKILRKQYTMGYLTTWSEAMDLFIQGDWDAANSLFQTLHMMLPLDGATRLMLQRTEGKRAPDNWEGYIDLT